MSTAAVATENAHDRLLLAAAELLEEAQGEPVSTRAICDRAGVQAPTLYHHFGSKDGLLDSVLRHGFGAFLASRGETGETGEDDDPIEAIREGWDLHVRFGLENPNFYILIYGRARPGLRRRRRRRTDDPRHAAFGGAAASPPDRARAGRPPNPRGVDRRCADADHRPSGRSRPRAVGPGSRRDPRRARDHAAPRRKPAGAGTVSSAAIALAATLGEDPEVLSAGEASLMREWLRRLSATPSLR